MLRALRIGANINQLEPVFNEQIISIWFDTFVKSATMNIPRTRES